MEFHLELTLRNLITPFTASLRPNIWLMITNTLVSRTIW